MSDSTAGNGPAASGDHKRRLAQLMAARLALMVAVFAIAISLVGAGKQGAELAERGLYGTLTLAFLSTAVCAALLPRSRRPERLAAAQLGADLLTVTAILFFTEGAQSIFSFLYLPLTVYAAIQFERRGAYAIALGASLCFAGLLAIDDVAPLRGGGAPHAWEWRFGVWGAHTGALLLVAMLASTLARERRVVSARLASSASDLRELRGLHQRMVDSLTSGLVTLDTRGVATSCNPEGARILNRAAREIVGNPLEGVLPGIGEVIERSERGARRMRLELALEGDERRFLGVAVSGLRDADGAQSGHVVIFQDVTQVVSLERALRRRERLAAVGELAAGVAHEIRNPLAAISGCVEMLRAPNRERSADPEQQRLMSVVLREIERLDALIADFLRFARPAAPKLEHVRVRDLLCEIADLCGSACSPGVGVRVDAAADVTALADPTQLRQVVWNLLRNAVEAVGEHGVVTLSASLIPNGLARDGLSQDDESTDRTGPTSGGDAVEIAVADDGPGIAPEVQERIFDPFFTTKAAGTGLGLPTVHRIVAAHGGAIEVTSQPGAGASFRLRLPAPGAES